MRNSPGDEIANVNFLYDDIVHALQNTIDWYINSATNRRGNIAEPSPEQGARTLQTYRRQTDGRRHIHVVHVR